LARLAVLSLAGVVCVQPEGTSRAAPDVAPAPRAVRDPALAGSTINALLDVTGGKPPATGKELLSALSRLGAFAQLPVVFSAVRLDSGIGNPRVILTPLVEGLSDAGVTQPSLNGRLYFAANMEKHPRADPTVNSVEFISWNTLRRKFDFGVIEDMGTDEPKLQVVEGGRCFACHKNRGPILSAGPWTNTTHLPLLRSFVADRLDLVAAVPAGAAGVGKRDRIDGMALVAPQADIVDGVVRLGAMLRLQRDTFRLMTSSEGGRKALVAMLVALTQPGPIDPNDRATRTAVDLWGNDSSYLRFSHDWVALARTTNTGILNDFAAFPRVQVSLWSQKIQPLPTPPRGGFTSTWQARQFEWKSESIAKNNEAIVKAVTRQTELIASYDGARAVGKHGMVSAHQPSNPKAFVPAPTKVTQKPSGMVNALMLANTIGLTEGDRKFLAEALADAVRRLTRQKVTPSALAKEVFTGSEFADVLGGGPLPDRDEFKDRFVAGLNMVLTVRYALSEGFTPERSTYASGPRRDPKAVEEVEAAVVPTSACLRCHDVRATKERMFEPIPALLFDPFDKVGRATWARNAEAKRKQEVLTRLQRRLFTDSDMPPQDSPEHALFRINETAAFDDLKLFLDAEIEKPKKP
jgi:hypothetical protein